MTSQQRDESNIDAAAVRARMRLFEDHNLAFQLQEQEYMSHYGRNRAERQLVGQDTRQSRGEQQREREEARFRHIRTLDTITAHDERVAQQLQAEIEREAKMMRELQLKRDEELAKRLAEEEQQRAGGSRALSASPSPVTPLRFVASNPATSTAIQPIRDLLTGDDLDLDESVQNELINWMLSGDR
ncbi:unnamed protein product, partial [Mesorhabditis spiculigera]